MSDPRKTGVSSITGKIVTIRHASEADLVRVGAYLAAQGMSSDFVEDVVVVAAETSDYDRIIGFGILKRGDDSGCVSLFEDSRRRGIGSAIMNHIMDSAKLGKVYAARYASYFTRPRFEMGAPARAGRSRRKAAACRMPLLERLTPAVS